MLKSNHPASSMQLGIVISDGKKLKIWLDVGLKIGAKEYPHVLKIAVKPWLCTCPHGKDNAVLAASQLCQSLAANLLASLSSRCRLPGLWHLGHPACQGLSRLS